MSEATEPENQHIGDSNLRARLNSNTGTTVSTLKRLSGIASGEAGPHHLAIVQEADSVVESTSEGAGQSLFSSPTLHGEDKPQNTSVIETPAPETIFKPELTPHVTNAIPSSSISLLGMPTQKPLTFKMNDKIYIIFPGVSQTPALPKTLAGVSESKDVSQVPASDAKRDKCFVQSKSTPIAPTFQINIGSSRMSPAVSQVSTPSSGTTGLGQVIKKWYSSKLNKPIINIKQESGGEEHFNNNCSCPPVINPPNMDIKQEPVDSGSIDDRMCFKTSDRGLVTPQYGSQTECSHVNQNWNSGWTPLCHADDCLVELSVALQMDNYFSGSVGPLSRNMVVTVVTESGYHPLYGYCQDSTEVTVTYDIEGRMKVIQTPYIQDGIYEVIPNGYYKPHRDFPNSYMQNNKFIRRSRTDDMDSGSRYVTLGGFCPVPKHIYDYDIHDLLSKKLADFLRTPDFRTYTLPLLLGHGQTDIWFSEFGSPETKPVFLEAKVDTEGWKLPETVEMISRICLAKLRETQPQLSEVSYIPGHDPFDDYGDVETEREGPVVRTHDRDCRCDKCMDPAELNALLNQLQTAKAILRPNTTSRKWKRSRSKSTTRVKRSKSSEKENTAAKQKTTSETSSSTSSDGMDSGDTLTPTSSQGETTLTSPASGRRSPSKRPRKRKDACDCPDCRSVMPLLKKVRFDAEPGDDPLTEVVMETRSA